MPYICCFLREVSRSCHGIHVFTFFWSDSPTFWTVQHFGHLNNCPYFSSHLYNTLILSSRNSIQWSMRLLHIVQTLGILGGILLYHVSLSWYINFNVKRQVACAYSTIKWQSENRITSVKTHLGKKIKGNSSRMSIEIRKHT